MRLYEIYKVKKDYQSFIIGREKLLYDLLTGNSHQQTIQEIQYLCDEIISKQLDNVIMNSLGKQFTEIVSDSGKYELRHPVKGSLHISVTPYYVQVICNGSRMLDLDLFISLSDTADRFFAVMKEEREWGWLKPVKRKEIQYTKNS